MLGLLLVAATILAYQPAWHAGFIWDDDDYVTTNPLLTAPDGLWRIWFSLDSPSQYFPLVYTVFRVEHALWGLNPAGFHWVNLLVHVANALLLWRLIVRLKIPGAWLAAAIFALHPVNVESVAWITQLKNTLSLFFCLLTVWLWVRFVEKSAVQGSRSTVGRSGSMGWYLAALACFALALFAKTTACTLPAALLLILWLQRKSIDWLRLAQVVPFVLMGVAMGFVSMWWEKHHQGTEGAVYAIGWAERLLIASRAVWFYLGKLLWPVGLSFNYPLWKLQPTNPLAWGWLAAGAVALALICSVRRRFGRGPEVAAMYFVAVLSPLLGFIMLYTFRYTFVADHYQYVAMIGPAVLVAAGLDKLLKREARKSKVESGSKPEIRNTGEASFELRPLDFLRISSLGFRTLAVLCAALLLTLATLSWRQCRMYSDLETLWRTTLERNPQSFMAYNNLGTIHLQRGELDEAVLHFKKALEIEPGAHNSRFNLGQILMQQQRFEEAAEQFRRSLEVQPRDAKVESDLGAALLQMGRRDEAITHCQAALRIEPDFADAHYVLANALFQSGRTEEAIAHYETVLNFRPDNAEIHNNLGWVLLQNGNTDAAIIHFQTVLKLQPDFILAEANLALALQQKGEARAAAAHYEAFLKQQPDALPVLNRLAWLLATSPDAAVRNGARALELAQHATLLTSSQSAVVLQTLAAAQAESGQFSDAAKTVEEAQTLPDTRSNPALIEALRAQLEIYRAGSPFRDTSTNGIANSHQP